MPYFTNHNQRRVSSNSPGGLRKHRGEIGNPRSFSSSSVISVAKIARIVFIAVFAVPPLPGFAGVSDSISTTSAAYQREVQRLVHEFGPRLLASRYMERDGCTSITYPGWEGFPLQLCNYFVTDRPGTRKPAKVIMLNPSPEQVARWVTYSVIATSGTISPEDGDKLLQHIICQSGGQFPVAGIVYEDMDGSGNRNYCFRNGVTVAIDGIPHATTASLTLQQIDLALTGTVTRVRRYARIQSTSPSDYTSNGGTVDVGTDTNPKPAWLEVVRESYQRAWGNDRNDLMIALARRKLATMPKLKPDRRCW